MGIFDIFGGGGGKNPADAANKYLNQMPGMLQQYSDPYIQMGNQAGQNLQNQFGQLTNDPGGRLNQIGQSYHQSPGFQFALQQALQGANQGAAAGGMAGSPQSQQQNMGIATGLADQDYNNWLQQATGMYNTGLNGQQNMYNTGANAGIGLGQNIASILGQQGQYAYAGQAAKNAQDAQNWGNIWGGLGAAASMFL